MYEGNHYQGRGFLKEAQDKQSKSQLLFDRYREQFKSAVIFFVAGFGFIFLHYLPIELSAEHQATEQALRGTFFIMALCGWGHGIAFWLAYKFVPSLTGFVSSVSMWFVMPSIVALQIF